VRLHALAAGALVAAGGVRLTLAVGAGVCAVCALAAIVALRAWAFGGAAALAVPDGEVQAAAEAGRPPGAGLLEMESETR